MSLTAGKLFRSPEQENNSTTIQRLLAQTCSHASERLDGNHRRSCSNADVLIALDNNSGGDILFGLFIFIVLFFGGSDPSGHDDRHEQSQ